MKPMFKTCLLIFSIFINISAFSQQTNYAFEGDLPRRAHLGFTTTPVGEGGLYDAESLMVSSVEAGSPAERAALKEGDILVSINDQASISALDAWERLRNLPGEVRIKLKVQREGQDHTVSFIPDKEPLENLEGVHTTYGVLTTEDGTALRTILTKPLNKEGPFPAIFVSDWTSCSSTEVPMRFQRGWINFLRGLIQTTGAMVLRIDKPGCGDSQGLCSELDFDETVRYQRKALQILKSHPEVDQENIFIDGESVGAFIAPLVAQDQNIKGIMVRAGGASTWFERMVNFERLQRELSGKPLEQVDVEMKQIIKFFHYYLTLGLALEDIFAEDPAMRQVWENQISHNSSSKHYGRPIEFHQQAHRHNFAKAWIESGARALVLFGEYDQFESESASRSLVYAINSVNPGYGKLIVYPQSNHQLEIFPSRTEALKGYRGPQIHFDLIGVDQPLKDVREWMRELMRQ